MKRAVTQISQVDPNPNLMAFILSDRKNLEGIEERWGLILEINFKIDIFFPPFHFFLPIYLIIQNFSVIIEVLNK